VWVTYRPDMPKYSTGSGGSGGDGGACELCGAESGSLRRATVAGAELLVCSDCAPHGSGGSGSGGSDGRDRSRGNADADDEDRNRKREAARNAARVYDAATGDSEHWEEEGTDYEDDRLPYLVSEYGDRVESGRQAVGLTVEELAERVDADADDVLAVEQNRAARAGVGGSVVRHIEEELEVTLVDE